MFVLYQNIATIEIIHIDKTERTFPEYIVDCEGEQMKRKITCIILVWTETNNFVEHVDHHLTH